MSSFVIASPDVLAAGAQDLTGIGSAVRAANAAAAASTTSVVAAASDEVSAAVSALFGGYAQEYQALSARVALSHEAFVRTLASGGLAYGAAEAANAGPLQPLLDLINLPTNLLFGRPLIGDGTNAAPGTGQAGGAGGVLFRKGGGRRAGGARPGRG